MRYEITLLGCDDWTVFQMNLSQEEFKLVKKIEEISKETSTYICMPTLEIVEVKE